MRCGWAQLLECLKWRRDPDVINLLPPIYNIIVDKGRDPGVLQFSPWLLLSNNDSNCPVEFRFISFISQYKQTIIK